MQYVDGHFQKIIAASDYEAKRVWDLLRGAGISYVLDISVVIESGRITKVIDFAVSNEEPEAIPL
ncbi:hypothetical protein CN311_11295 [Mesorhizobium sanjuanii]|uniref:Uncharacterized protein n=1 Tax=Mesorhizobium sanjuanii TaxID=2037900 RepID=A0A2A6FGW2_9HYPH|nr:hypothetical protein CN311_11295 [Mesorhizobium sanjuanii]